jgi:formylglycine-generating enzyme required for sulfatase activity
MGDLNAGTTYGTVLAERLVVVSPFFLGATEVTVGAYRASGLLTRNRVLLHETQATCTFTGAPAGNEGLPINCITRPGAIAYCAKGGGRLPTEAEWEYVAGARRSALTVWGDDPARCEDAVFARDPAASPADATGACIKLGSGPASSGSGALDRLALAGGTLLDVAGNVTEWLGDAWADEGTPCWQGALLSDPLCATGSPGATVDYAVRGGSYGQPGTQLRAALRARVSSDGDPFSALIGFRCARPDAP